jgi:hypothetical protein
MFYFIKFVVLIDMSGSVHCTGWAVLIVLFLKFYFSLTNVWLKKMPLDHLCVFFFTLSIYLHLLEVIRTVYRDIKDIKRRI